MNNAVLGDVAFWAGVAVVGLFVLLGTFWLGAFFALTAMSDDDSKPPANPPWQIAPGNPAVVTLIEQLRHEAGVEQEADVIGEAIRVYNLLMEATLAGDRPAIVHARGGHTTISLLPAKSTLVAQLGPGGPRNASRRPRN